MKSWRSECAWTEVLKVVVLTLQAGLGWPCEPITCARRCCCVTADVFSCGVAPSTRCVVCCCSATMGRRTIVYILIAKVRVRTNAKTIGSSCWSRCIWASFGWAVLCAAVAYICSYPVGLLLVLLLAVRRWAEAVASKATRSRSRSLSIDTLSAIIGWVLELSTVFVVDGGLVAGCASIWGCSGPTSSISDASCVAFYWQFAAFLSLFVFFRSLKERLKVRRGWVCGCGLLWFEPLRRERCSGSPGLCGCCLCFLGRRLWILTGTRPYQWWSHYWMPLLFIKSINCCKIITKSLIT